MFHNISKSFPKKLLKFKFSSFSNKISQLRFSDEVVIVTGGSSGIGKATCLQFAKEGAKVVIVDIDETEALRVTQEISTKFNTPSYFIKADVSKVSDAENISNEVIKKYGRVDVLVNSAAKFVLKGFEATEEEWHKSFAVNVIGNSFVSKYAAEAMKKNGGGAIVNVASISSWIAQPDFFVYSTSKAAILQLTRNMALDLGQFNIRVNCVCPGTILTPASVNFIESIGLKKEDLIKDTEDKTILKRIGQPDEIATAIAFLASRDAKYITGTHLMVDGGYTTV